MLFALLTAAYAAEFTELPPQLRGNIDIGYTGDFGYRTLEEKRQLVGAGWYQRHDLMFSGEFSPLPWVALNLAVPYTPSWSMDWDDAWEMRYDPTTETGTYVGGEEIIDGVTRTASGSEGVWFGAAVAPFSRNFDKSGLLHQLVDWRLGLAYRTGNKHTLWSAPDGVRGVAPGGGAVKVSAAFSTTRGGASPYLAVNAVFEGKPVDVEVIDEDGTNWGTTPVDAASTLDVRGGVEITDAEVAEGGYRFVWDLYCGFGYQTWQDIPSGFWLPTVLDASREIVVTETDFAYGRLGMSALVDVNHWAGFRLGVEGRYNQPHRVEHPYPVFWSYDSFDVVAIAEIEGRIRDADGK